MTSGRFSRPELHHDETFDQAQQFAVQRRYNAVLPITGRISGANVITVSDDPDNQMDDALRAAGASVLGQLGYGYARQGFVRSALRPAAQGGGRGRWR